MKLSGREYSKEGHLDAEIQAKTTMRMEAQKEAAISQGGQRNPDSHQKQGRDKDRFFSPVLAQRLWLCQLLDFKFYWPELSGKKRGLFFPPLFKFLVEEAFKNAFNGICLTSMVCRQEFDTSLSTETLVGEDGICKVWGTTPRGGVL